MSTHERLAFDAFEYLGYHGCQSFCKLEIIRLVDGRTVAIVTELADNPGTSVTNVAEYLASEVCDRFGIDPDHLIWIETYGSPAPGGRPRTFDQVTFERRDRSGFIGLPGVWRHRPTGWPGRFCRPSWRAMTDDDWQVLGLEVPPKVV